MPIISKMNVSLICLTYRDWTGCQDLKQQLGHPYTEPFINYDNKNPYVETKQKKG